MDDVPDGRGHPFATARRPWYSSGITERRVARSAAHFFAVSKKRGEYDARVFNFRFNASPIRLRRANQDPSSNRVSTGPDGQRLQTPVALQVQATDCPALVVVALPEPFSSTRLGFTTVPL